MPNENDFILAQLKQPSSLGNYYTNFPLRGNTALHDQEFFSHVPLSDMRPLPFRQIRPFEDRLDSNVSDEIDDRRNWSKGRIDAGTNMEYLVNFLKHNIGRANPNPMPADAGDALSTKAGYYDIDSHPLSELRNISLNR